MREVEKLSRHSASPRPNAPAKAKGRAQMTYNLNNHLQVMLAMIRYCGDNNDTIPQPGRNFPITPEFFHSTKSTEPPAKS
jgi:hypothetical protein